jgi:protein TonB
VHIVSEIDQGLHAPTKIPKDIKMIKEDAPPPSSVGVAGMSGMGSGSSTGVAGMANLGLASPPPVVQRVVKPAGPQRVSSGVVQGLAISQPQPVYPPIAKAAHVQGVVVLHAIISKTGTIENLNVISGPPMLTGAAVDAVKRWRYKPYLLSGEPTEVETTINVNFTFSGG